MYILMSAKKSAKLRSTLHLDERLVMDKKSALEVER